MTWRCVIYHQQTTTNCWRSDYLLIIGSSVVKHTIINKVSNIILTHDISTCVVILTSHALALLCECGRFSAVGQRWLISSAMHHTHRRLMLNTPPYNSVCVCVCLSVSVTVTRPRCAHMLCVWGVNISRFFFGWTVFTVPLVYEIMHSLGVWSKRLRQNGDKPKRLPVQSKRINLLSPTMDLFSELLTKFQCIQVCSFCSSVIS